MICSVCGNECMVDHVENGRVVFVCLNRNCGSYGMAFCEDGEASSMEIREKGID